MSQSASNKLSRAALLAANLRLRGPDETAAPAPQPAAASPPPAPPPRGLPAGCSLLPIPGGRFKALVGDLPLKHAAGNPKAGKPVVFASRDEATAALWRFTKQRS